MHALLAQPHHDGSETYVPETPAELGDDVTVLLRIPKASSADAVAVRYVRDGEPQIARAEIDRETDADVWWRATFPIWNVATPYRWLLSGGDVGYAWLNGMGVQSFDVPDADDFVLSPGDGGPEWHLESVVYEVFPDRFASSGREVMPPEWAIPRGWDELPTGRGPDTPVEWFGGDLRGIEERLDHVLSLGANVLYLTPVFPAGSTHRYDATSFDSVDPLLGGDEAFSSLVRTAHAKGIRVLGDLTTNHVGSGHEWFLAAQERREPERGFFYFDDAYEHGYACWYGVPSLPKLDYESRGASRAHVRRVVGRRAPLARVAVRPRRLAYRRREHDGSIRRRRLPPGRRVRRAAGGHGDAIRRARRRRARVRRADRPPSRRLARHDELRRLHAPGVGVAARGQPALRSRERLHRASRRRAAAPRSVDRPHDARIPRGHPVDGLAPLVGDPRQP